MDGKRGDMVVIGVDTGGTFTDVFASSGVVLKVPSTPADPARAILQALREVGMTARDAVGHGTTVATNAVLERKGARTVLITTAGFEDVLEIRRQNRPSLYDLDARWPEPLVGRDFRMGLRERLDYHGDIVTPLDGDEVATLVAHIAETGAESVAVCFLFSYANPDHERTIASALAQRLGTEHPVSLSHEIAPHYGEFERTSTTVVNAYVMPVVRRYLNSLQDGLADEGMRQLHVMHSNGGLVSAKVAAERPVQTVLSGPAAGVVGAHALAVAAGHEHTITFDMGGTSTDVSVVPGEVMERGEGEISSFPLLVPMLQIETVGAGGGSIARVDAGGRLHVGPESAGADPGPAAYGRGTRPTVTDANLVLGRLSARGLLGGRMSLDGGRARDALQPTAQTLGLSIEQAAWAVVRLANSNMERAVRAVTLQRGHDPRRFTLVPFGGAGPLHAAELAADLGIEWLLVPPHPGVLAALGLTIPDLQRDFQRTVLLPLADGVEAELESAFQTLSMRADEEFQREELFGEPLLRRWVDARYSGQSFELRIPYSGSATTLLDAYTRAYEQRYGYATPERQVDIVNVRLRAVLPRLRKPNLIPDWPEAGPAADERKVWFGSQVGVQDVRSVTAQVLWRPSLVRGTVVEGPAIVEQYDSATVLPPGSQATVDDSFNLLVKLV